MEEGLEGSYSLNVNNNITSRKSWLNYIKITIIFLIVLGILSSILLQEGLENSIIISICYGLIIINILFFLYKILYLRSHILYYDEDGVWLFSGIFPWNKGINGVRWGDLDDAGYITGFFSWLFHSHTIRISHKYTKSAEILHANMSNAVHVVSEINSILRKKNRN